MIQISQASVTPGLVPKDDVLEAQTPHAGETAQADSQSLATGAGNADPQGKFTALFGSPALAHSFYADKNGPSGKSGPTQYSAPAAPIGGPKATTLQLGSSGPAVKTLQQQINKWRAAQSPAQSPIAENGRFTAETRQAVAEFQKANRVATGILKFDETPNGIADIRVQNRLRLENDPMFAKLTPDNKKYAREALSYAHLDGARAEPVFTLLANPAFEKISEQAQANMLEPLGPAPLHADHAALSNADLVKEYEKLLASSEFRKLDPGVQGSVVAHLTNSARPDASLTSTDVPQRIRSDIDSLIKVVTQPALNKLPPDEQRLLVRTLSFAAPDKAGFADALSSLLRSPRFDALKPAEKTAVVNQIYNYADARSVANIERMLTKDWFRTQDLGDKQRSLKTIAYLSQHDKGSREVIDNTLDRLLAPGSDIKLRWADLDDSDGWGSDEANNTITWGEGDAKTRTLTLNSSRLDADDKPVPNNRDGNMLVLHTVAHEVNHLLNNDQPRKGSFQHFEIEFRAWAVGFKAEHGHWPTNKEAMVRVRHLLTATDGAYGDIKGAGRKYHDAMAMYDFLRKMTGFEVTAGNLDEVLKSRPSTWRNWSRDPDERALKQSERMAPIADGNLDNK